MRPPVQPERQKLPFHDSAFGWDTFEEFFCDFLNSQPEIALNDGGRDFRKKVIRARPFGRKGDSQYGIDLLAEMEGGETWDFQCKHYKAWGPKETENAIAEYARNSPRKFLLVTRDVSEECRKVVETNSGWSIWDASEINRRFRELNADKGARIMFTHFGPGWDTAFFGVTGAGPLIGAEAKFERQLVQGHRFHHRHHMVGRTELLDDLDSFVRDPKARVFIFTGRGGVGKSRLLLEWSRHFTRRHPEQTLQFLWDRAADFGPSLQVAPKPLTLVFDDAHRLNDLRRALFPELPRSSEIKLVLSLRPGPVDEVLHELHDVGFDSTEIVVGKTIKSLSAEEAMRLVDSALNPNQWRSRHLLHHVSRDCPLVAVIGAELLNAGALKSGDLLDEAELKGRVFDSLLDDAAPVRVRFGPREVDEFLRLIALLGPVVVNSSWLERAAAFIGIPNAGEVSHLRDALDEVGLLLTTGAGTRVTPDLLSDHLAYTACYDREGKSRTFAERVLEQFSPETFPKLVQHLAESEWRALDEVPNAESVVEPLWQWFVERFKRSEFYQRNTQIQEWANISYLQPERSIKLAEMAIAMKTAPETEKRSVTYGAWNTYEQSLEWLPRMLARVAEHHVTNVARCFDLLWKLAEVRQGQSDLGEGHPLSLMGDVLAFKFWKPLGISNAAFDWLERLLATDEWRRVGYSFGNVVGNFCNPAFATSIENTWGDSRTVHFESIPVHIAHTRPFRERVLTFLRGLLVAKEPYTAFTIISILVRACDVARTRFGAAPARTFVEEWEGERMKALAVLEDAIVMFDAVMVRFKIRHSLLGVLQLGGNTDAFRTECRRVVDSIPSSLELLVARAVCSDAHNEFDTLGEYDTYEITRARWKQFLGEVAAAVVQAHPTADLWLAFLASLRQQWEPFGEELRFEELLAAIAVLNSRDAVAASELLTAQPEHPLAEFVNALIIAATDFAETERIRLIRAVFESENERLQYNAIACCAEWRWRSEVPEVIWSMIEKIAPAACGRSVYGIVHFIRVGRGKSSLRDWQLLTALPLGKQDANLTLVATRMAVELVEERGLKPDTASIARFLACCDSVVTRRGGSSARGFDKLAKVFPEEIFELLWKRKRALKAGKDSDVGFHLAIRDVRLQSIVLTPVFREVAVQCERRLAADEELDLDEARVLRVQIENCSEGPSRWLEVSVDRATSQIGLENLCAIAGDARDVNAALAFPDFARCVLKKARAIGAECFQNIFKDLIGVPGGRSSSNGEPDDSWKTLVESLRKRAEEYASDIELGPLFKRMAERESFWMEAERRRSKRDEEDE